jgi:hypothetical protein
LKACCATAQRSGPTGLSFCFNTTGRRENP